MESSQAHTGQQFHLPYLATAIMSSRSTLTPLSTHDGSRHVPSPPHPSTSTSNVPRLFSPGGEARSEEDIGTFSGQPIGKVPLPPPQVEDMTYVQLEIFGPRQEVEAKNRLAWRREAILNIMHQAIPSQFRLRRYDLSDTSKRMVQHVLDALTQLLVGLPHRVESGEVGFYISPASYEYFLDYLASIQKKSIPMLLAQGQGVPPLPRWGPRGKPELVWSCGVLTAYLPKICLYF